MSVSNKQRACFFGLTLALTAGTAQAADMIVEEPVFQESAVAGVAVSEINGKVEFGYIHYGFTDNLNNFNFNNFNIFDSGEAYFAQGSVSLPVGQKFGLQIDAGLLDGSLSTNPVFFGPTPDIDINARGIGGHFFWRDSTQGLLGAYAHYTSYTFGGGGGNIDIDNTRLAVEAEGYMDRFTLKAMGGIDHLDVEGLGSDQFLYASGEVDFYINEDLMIFAGIEHSFEETSGKVGIEAMFNTGGISPSAFATASFNDTSTAVSAGIKVYFGSSSKSLMKRHREDDPQINLFDANLPSCVGSVIGSFAGPRVSNSLVYEKERKAPDPSLDGCGVSYPMYYGPPA